MVNKVLCERSSYLPELAGRVEHCPDWLKKAKQTSGLQIIKITVLNCGQRY